MRGRRRSIVVLSLLVVAVAAIVLLLSLRASDTFSFARPWALLLLALVPLAAWVSFSLGHRRRATFGFSSLGVLARLRAGPMAMLVPLPPVLRVVALALLVTALARPQTRARGARVEMEGIDIMIALDLSNSMEAEDLVPNRLEAAKKVIDRFIARRRSDRIGLVIFGREAFTQCPLTLDYAVLRNMLAELRIDLIDGKATAIGNAIGVSLARLRRSDAKSRVVILLTDGDNNAGKVSPREATRYATAMKVKVFTILMGPREGATKAVDRFGRRTRLRQQFPVNPKLLEEIAATTGGKAYLATDRRALEQNFEQILDELDKSTRHDIPAVFTDAHLPFVWLALVMLLFEALLRLTRFKEFP